MTGSIVKAKQLGCSVSVVFTFSEVFCACNTVSATQAGKCDAQGIGGVLFYFLQDSHRPSWCKRRQKRTDTHVLLLYFFCVEYPITRAYVHVHRCVCVCLCTFVYSCVLGFGVDMQRISRRWTWRSPLKSTSPDVVPQDVCRLTKVQQ